MRFALQRRAIFRQFFDIETSKSASDLRCFVHFHFEMCFSPQPRAIFRHRNLKKCSEPEVFCAFSLQNVLFATAACNFWFLLWPHDSAPAALTGLLFDWPDTRIIEKTQHFATSLTFGADVSSFFWLSHYCIFLLLSWLLYYCAFHLLFNSPYCRKFLFKLPSTKWQNRFKSIQKPCLNPQTRFEIPYPPVSNSWLKPHPIHNPNF